MLSYPVRDVVVGGRPLKVHDMRYFDALLVQESKSLGVIDEQSVGGETSKVLVVVVPSEIGPREIDGTLDAKRALLLTRSHTPNNKSLVVDASFARIERNQEVLVGREIDQLDALMSETHELKKSFAGPQSNTTLVESGQIGSFRRPLKSSLGPFL